MIDGATPMRASVNANCTGLPRHHDVAGTHQTEPAGAHMPVDGADHRHRKLEDPAQQVGQLAGAVDSHIAGIAPGGFGEIRAGAEGSAGVSEHDGPHTGLLGGVG